MVVHTGTTVYHSFTSCGLQPEDGYSFLTRIMPKDSSHTLNVTLNFDASIIGPIFGQDTATSDVATQGLTIQGQAPFASAVTNKDSGSIFLNAQAPIGAGNYGHTSFQNGGVTYFRVENGAGTQASLSFDIGAPSPILQQLQAAVNAATQSLTVQAQTAAATGSQNNGGALILITGGASVNGTTGFRGKFQVGLGSSNMIMLESTELFQNQRVVSLAKRGALTTTSMPVNSGDGVVYIGDAGTNPTAAPANGHIVYSTGGNAAYYTSGGTNITLPFTTSSLATGGAITPPGMVVGYLRMTLNGTDIKVPYYAV